MCIRDRSNSRPSRWTWGSISVKSPRRHRMWPDWVWGPEWRGATDHQFFVAADRVARNGGRQRRQVPTGEAPINVKPLPGLRDEESGQERDQPLVGRRHALLGSRALK